MAMVYPADPNAPPPMPAPHRSIFDFAGDHPALIVVLLLGVALLVGYVIHKIVSGGSSSTTDTSGMSSNNGQQVLYVPTSNEFLNYSQVTGSYNPVTTTNTDADEPKPKPILPMKPPKKKKKKDKEPDHDRGGGGLGGGGFIASARGRGWGNTYAMGGGDSLDSVAAFHNTTWPTLYQHNQETIDTHGGPWSMMPAGTVLWVPG